MFNCVPYGGSISMLIKNKIIHEKEKEVYDEQHLNILNKSEKSNIGIIQPQFYAKYF